MIKFIKEQIKSSIEVKQAIFNDNTLLNNIDKAAQVLVNTYKNGCKVLIAGNGGSAGDAQHVAGELVNKLYFDRPGLSCIALSTDTSVLTAVGNDYGFDRIFLRQIEANGNSGDVFIGISTSGNSENIVKAMEFCKTRNIITIGLSGAEKCKLDEVCDHIIKIPSYETPRIQESHLLVEHIICTIVERSIFSEIFELWKR